MIVHDYICHKCNIVREVRHKMNDEPHVLCDNCGKEMAKMISSPQVNYKGEWFRTKGKY